MLLLRPIVFTENKVILIKSLRDIRGNYFLHDYFFKISDFIVQNRFFFLQFIVLENIGDNPYTICSVLMHNKVWCNNYLAIPRYVLSRQRIMRRISLVLQVKLWMIRDFSESTSQVSLKRWCDITRDGENIPFRIVSGLNLQRFSNLSVQSTEKQCFYTGQWYNVVHHFGLLRLAVFYVPRILPMFLLGA